MDASLGGSSYDIGGVKNRMPDALCSDSVVCVRVCACLRACVCVCKSVLFSSFIYRIVFTPTRTVLYVCVQWPFQFGIRSCLSVIVIVSSGVGLVY